MNVKGIRKEILNAQPYIPGKTITEIQEERGLSRVVKLGSNENPYGPFPASLRAMERELVNLNRYPDIRFERIKGLLADRYGLTPQSIALSHGAEGMLQTLGKCFINPGDEVILPQATYNLYTEITKLMGGILLPVPMREDFRINLEDVSDRVSPRTKLIWLANPNNPTGTLFNPDSLELLLKTLPETAWVVLDEAYAEFAAPGDLPDRSDLIRRGYNLISIRTFSKAWGLAGARLGYAIARPEMIKVIDTVSEPFNANRIALAGGEAVLTEGLDDFKSSCEAIVQTRDWITRELDRLGCRPIPSKANFVFFESSLVADDLAERLLAHGIIVRSCSWWGFDHGIRVTVGTPEESTLFVEALEKILKNTVLTEGEKRA